tara:strand:- start:924 stop:1439 length:516 start_codon:yes stop_codon:yes gene_type:complete
MGYTSYLQKYEIIRVTPTLSTDQYAQGDVLFVATEIPNAVRENGGCSKLVGGYVFDKSDGSDDITFVFTEGNTALGTINATANISDADLLANNICGITKVDSDQATSSAWIDNSKIHQMLPGSSVSENTQDLLLLQAASGSKSVFIQGILVSSTTPTFADGDLQIILHIEK